MSQAKATLKEAFPDVDEAIIEAVLIASGGSIEPAFNALLGMLKSCKGPN
jgi:CDK inhibitor PHO81